MPNPAAQLEMDCTPTQSDKCQCLGRTTIQSDNCQPHLPKNIKRPCGHSFEHLFDMRCAHGAPHMLYTHLPASAMQPKPPIRNNLLPAVRCLSTNAILSSLRSHRPHLILSNL